MSNDHKGPAIIFDMDGVLLDSERIALASWRQVLRERDCDPDEELLLATVGVDLEGTLALLRDRFGDQPYDDIARRRYAVGEQMMAQSGPPTRRGIPGLLRMARGLAVGMAVATTTPAKRAGAYLEKAGLLAYFDTVIGGDMVQQSKPAPDIYLTAARAIGVSPETCLAVEDSGPGIQSALAAGMTVICLEDLKAPPKSLLAQCAGHYRDAAALAEDLAGFFTSLPGHLQDPS